MFHKHRNTSSWKSPITVSIICIGMIASAGIASAGPLGGLGGGLGGALGGGGLGGSGGSIGGSASVGGAAVGGSAKVGGGNTNVGTTGNFNLGGLTSSVDRIGTNLTDALPDLNLPGTLSGLGSPVDKPVLQNRVRCNGMMSGSRLSWNHPQICG